MRLLAGRIRGLPWWMQALLTFFLVSTLGFLALTYFIDPGVIPPSAIKGKLKLVSCSCKPSLVLASCDLPLPPLEALNTRDRSILRPTLWPPTSVHAWQPCGLLNHVLAKSVLTCAMHEQTR